MRIAIVGSGTAGAAAALFLARSGHEVEIFERVPDPLPVGAGILLQPLGQRILGELGLADALAAMSSPVRRIEGLSAGDRVVLRFGYEDAGVAEVGLGVHRGSLFRLLWDALGTAGIPVRTGWEVDRIEVGVHGWQLAALTGETAGPFDLVVGADGARSRVRRELGLASKDVRYPYGAMWSVVPDPDGLAGDVLTQRYRDTRTTLGILPTGAGQASIFWSIRTRDIDSAVAAGPAPLVRAMLPFAGQLAPLVERAADVGVLGAVYRDVVVSSAAVMRNGFGAAVIGDAAHAMSPQLGMGASLALADALVLGRVLQGVTLEGGPAALAAALSRHAANRRNHIRWYTWLSRFMTPVFQSDLVPIGWARDLTFGPAARVPWVRRQFANILLGEQTSPFTAWRPPETGPR